MCVLIAFLTTGLDTLQIKDMSREVSKSQTALKGIDQIFLEKSETDKKKKKSKNFIFFKNLGKFLF